MFLLAEAVLTSTHNLRFRAKLRKKGIPLQIPVFLYKNGIQWVYFSWTCFPDGINRQLLDTTQTNCFETVSKEKKTIGCPQVARLLPTKSLRKIERMLFSYQRSVVYQELKTN